jgi:hypothetical protein
MQSSTDTNERLKALEELNQDYSNLIEKFCKIVELSAKHTVAVEDYVKIHSSGDGVIVDYDTLDKQKEQYLNSKKYLKESNFANLVQEARKQFDSLDERLFTIIPTIEKSEQHHPKLASIEWEVRKTSLYATAVSIKANTKKSNDDITTELEKITTELLIHQGWNKYYKAVLQYSSTTQTIIKEEIKKIEKINKAQSFMQWIKMQKAKNAQPSVASSI